MALVSLGAPPPPVGLDIGTDLIRVAQVRQTNAGPQLIAYNSVAMPSGAVVEGEIVDPVAVTSAIKDLWRFAGIRSREVAIGVSNHKVVVRLIELPFMERNELAGAIQFQAQDYIPIPVEEAIIDFHVIGEYVTPADEHMMEVMLVAAERDMVASVVAAVEGAGLKLVQIDVTAFALVRALIGSDQSWLPEEGDDPNAAVGIVHMSSGITNIAVVENGIPRFTRVSSLAGNHFTQALVNTLNITFDEAEDLKMTAGLPAVDGSSMPPDTPEGQKLLTTQEVLEREANKFIAEVRRSLDYYLTQVTQVRTIRRIILSGSSSEIPNLASYLEKGLQTQVVIGDPLSQVSTSGAAEQSVVSDRAGSAPAIGLALGGVS